MEWIGLELAKTGVNGVQSVPHSRALDTAPALSSMPSVLCRAGASHSGHTPSFAKHLLRPLQSRGVTLLDTSPALPSIPSALCRAGRGVTLFASLSCEGMNTFKKRLAKNPGCSTCWKSGNTDAQCDSPTFSECTRVCACVCVWCVFSSLTQTSH